jgi:adenosine deaminase/DNA-binding NarL/FixJ family response regulator
MCGISDIEFYRKLVVDYVKKRLKASGATENQNRQQAILLADANVIDPRILRDFIMDRGRRRKAVIDVWGGKAANKIESTKAIVSLIFMGAAWSLEVWDDSGKTPEFKNSEFYIRALQNYGVAAYVGGVESGTAPSNGERDAGGDDNNDYKDARFWSGLHRWNPETLEGLSEFHETFDEISRDITNLRELSERVLQAEYFYETNLRTASGERASPDEQFLHILSAIDQLENHPAKETRGKIQDIPWLNEFGGDTFAVQDRIHKAQRKFKFFEQSLDIRDIEGAREMIKTLEEYSKIRAYNILRDLSVWFRDGVFQWARRQESLRVLISDENLVSQTEGAGQGNEEEALAPVSENRTLENILAIFNSLVLKNDGRPRVDILKGGGITLGAPEWDRSLVERDRYLREKKRVESVDLIRGEFSGETQERLEDYDIILAELEYPNQFAGPREVQWLAAHFERTSDIRVNESCPQRRPVVMVLSRGSYLQNIHESLNLGAEAYIPKNSIYQLPSRIKRALSGTVEKRERGNRERLGRRSNFRALYYLSPDRKATLESVEPQHIVRGYLDSPEPSEPPQPGKEPSSGESATHQGFVNADRKYSREKPSFRTSHKQANELERRWIQQLPKADLHCHFGTCIRLDTIEALAYNTSGYLFVRHFVTGQRANVDAFHSSIEDALRKICHIILLAQRLRDTAQPDQAPTRLLLAAAIVLNKKPEDVPSQDPFGTILKWLRRDDRSIQVFEICSLFVAAVHFASKWAPAGGESKAVKSSVANIKERWDYFWHLSNWHRTEVKLRRAEERAKEKEEESGCMPSGNGEEAETGPWIDHFLFPVLEQCQRIMHRDRWRRSLTRNSVAANLPRRSIVTDGGWYSWTDWLNRIKERVERVETEFAKGFGAASTQSVNRSDYEGKLRLFSKHFPNIVADAPLAHPFTLEDIVRLPAGNNGEDKTLERYLWGASLLGGDHLQYPENVLLATKDLVHQNVEDEVVYSEVRCDSIGYCDGGMGPEDATDLLCLSFDLAIAFFREVGSEGKAASVRRPFVRVNILLAGKRHKPLENCARTISLLTKYLEKGPLRLVEPDIVNIPVWWRPTQVVGFDLSGKEGEEKERQLAELMKPLFRNSSPVTIHAGEAATADSIWNAVYQYGARRIGHGLRLRENDRLLNFCITEGICMEMCPISNEFTNDFRDAPARDEYIGLPEYYPLREYLQRGLEVCINTDNRSLHRDGEQTLTAEYLAAARKSGGLTKWEILKLVKAGFKHAFIDKEDIAIMLQAVEDRVYGIVANSRY